MSSDAVIALDSLGKCYQIYDKPRDRLLQMFFRGHKRFYREFWALRDINLHVASGEVVGVIGSNGAGKSTLLQLICGTLSPTCGELKVKGRVAALLELGAGFNPEFTGRENIYLSAAVTGMPREEIRAKFDEIVEFSGIAQFIDQPVKTYSSGMYVRLAFSVAINVDPDILIIDEALSVGDGEFARKSFDRIMSMKNSGKTILFCSHALYQVEALCSRVIWLDKGLARDHGEVGRVINSYESFLQKKSWSPSEFSAFGSIALDENDGVVGTSRLKSMQISVNSCIQDNKIIQLNSLIEDLELMVSYDSDSSLPAPSVAIVFVDINGNNVTSVGTHVDRFVVERNSSGYGVVNVLFPKVPLLKGEYTIDVYLLCESGIHVYDYSHSVAKIVVKQKTLEQGVFSIPHKWF